MTDRTTLLTAISAFLLAVLCIHPHTRGIFPLWVIAAGGHIADTLFHEMGHTIFNWLFGQPAIPMIFTLFGADQAGGMSMTFGRSWFIQIAVLAGLGYSCWQAKKSASALFIPALIFTGFIILVILLGYQQLIVLYMGHGGSILMGGYFLFRAWIYLDARNAYERWLNAFFGFFLILSNFGFAYGLAFDPYANSDYSDHVAFGVSHNDFMAMSLIVHSWSVKGIAIFTMGLCVASIIGSAICAVFLRDAFYTETPDVF